MPFEASMECSLETNTFCACARVLLPKPYPGALLRVLLTWSPNIEGMASGAAIDEWLRRRKLRYTRKKWNRRGRNSHIQLFSTRDAQRAPRMSPPTAPASPSLHIVRLLSSDTLLHRYRRRVQLCGLAPYTLYIDTLSSRHGFIAPASLYTVSLKTAPLSALSIIMLQNCCFLRLRRQTLDPALTDGRPDRAAATACVRAGHSRAAHSPARHA